MSWWIFILLFTLFLAVFIGTVVGIHNYLITYDSKRKEKIINSLRNLSNDYDVKRMFFEEVRSDHDFSAYIRREAKSRINAIVANEKQNWINHISRAINVLEKKEKDRLEEYRSYKKVLTYLEQMYIIGEDEKVLRNSPLLEAYNKAGTEVLILDDYDEDRVVTPMIGEYKEWELKDITSIEAPDSKTDEEKEEIAKEFKTLTDKIKEALGEEIKEVKISTRLTSSPSCVVKDASDPMASMAGMFASMGQQAPEIPHILEINPDHEMIKKLDTLDDTALFEDIAWVLLDSAKLSEGLEPKDKASFASRVANIATKAL